MLRRPLGAVIVVVLVVLVGARPLERLDQATDASDWWTVGLIGWIAYLAILCLAFPRIVKRSANDLIVVLWSFAVAPSLLAYAAKVAELVEMWTYYVAASVSAALLALSTWRAVVASRGQS